jgi:hypothetical protein
VDVDNIVGSTPLEMRSAGLDWIGTCPCSWSCFFFYEGYSVAYKCFPFVWWTLYPCQHNGRICPQVGFIYC